MDIQLKKYHALGNDYLIYDTQKNEGALTGEQIKQICHRNFGIGSDGILAGPVFHEGVPGVKIYNPDGSEAEISGNGIRIFAKYLKDAGYITEERFEISTLGGTIWIQYLDEEGDRMKVAMGKASFWSEEIPVAGEPREVIKEKTSFHGREYEMNCVSVGNPHCVIFVDEPTREYACWLGEEVESAPCFPNKINVQLAKIMDRENMAIEIFERGAGYTLASGSSCCAAACVARRLGLIDKKVTVHMPGGNLEIHAEDDGTVFIIGSADVIGEIHYRLKV